MTSKAKTKNGMAELADVILGLQSKGVKPSDIKRMVSAMSPAGAAALVAKHNRSNPNSQWSLLKKDPNGGDTLDNMVDKNNDGIPDVIVVNKDGNPMIVNGYTTTKSKWADDLVYYNAFPTRSARKAERLRHLDENGQPVKSYGRDDYIRDQKGVRYFTYDDVTRPEQLQYLGRVTESHPERLPQWYAATHKAPRSQSAYDMYKKYIFGPAFDDAIARVEESSGQNIPGTQKMLLHSKLCGSTWNDQVRRELDPNHQLSQTDFDKLRKRKTVKPRLEQLVQTLAGGFKDNVNTHSYDNLVDLLVNGIQRLLNLPANAIGGNELHIAPLFGGVSGYGRPEPINQEFYDGLAEMHANDAPDVDESDFLDGN